MKIDFFKKIAQKIKSQSLEGEEAIIRDWQWVVTILILLLLVFAFLCWEFNRKIVNYSKFKGEVSHEVISINRNLMDNVTNFFRTEEQFFKQDKNSGVDLADPSR